MKNRSGIKTILSLFDFTGNWVKPYHEAGYRTIQIDIKHGDDVMSIDKAWVEKHGPFHGILIAHPCDHNRVEKLPQGNDSQAIREGC